MPETTNPYSAPPVLTLDSSGNFVSPPTDSVDSFGYPRFNGSAPNTDMSSGVWEKFGIFEKNRMTGEMRLHPIAGAIGALADTTTSRGLDGKPIDSIIYGFKDQQMTMDELDNYVFRKFDPQAISAGSDSGKDRFDYQTSGYAAKQSLRTIGNSIADFYRMVSVAPLAAGYEVEKYAKEKFADLVADDVSKIGGLSKEKTDALKSQMKRAVTPMELLNAAQEYVTGESLTGVTRALSEQLKIDSRPATPRTADDKGLFGPILKNYYGGVEDLLAGTLQGDTDKRLGGIADMIEASRVVAEQGLASTVEMLTTNVLGKAVGLASGAIGSATELQMAEAGIPRASIMAGMIRDKAATEFQSKFLATAFGTVAGSETYETSRDQFGLSPIKSAFLGATVGLVSGVTENWAALEMLGGNGTNPFRALGKEALQEFIQGSSQRLAETYGDPNKSILAAKDFWGSFTKSFDDAIVGGMSGFSTHVAAHAFSKNENTRNKALKEGQQPVIKLEDLSRDQLDAMMHDFGVFQRVLDEMRPADGKEDKLLPHQEAMLRTFADRYGNYEKIGTIVNEALKFALDPKAYGLKTALKDASDLQVFDSPVKDAATGGDLPHDSAVKMMTPQITDVKGALDAANTDTSEAKSVKHFQVAAQSKIAGLEWMVEHVGMFSHDDFMAIIKSMGSLYTNQASTKLAPAQRARFLNLMRQAASVSGHPEAKDLYESLLKIVDGDVKAKRAASNTELWRMADSLSARVLDNLNPDQIEIRVGSTIDEMVERYGTVLPEELSNRLVTLVGQLANGAINNFGSDETSRKKSTALLNAAKKIGSVVNDPEAVLNALQPHRHASFLEEMKTFEWNLTTQARTKIIQATAAFEALTGRKVGMYVLQKEKDAISEIETQDSELAAKLREKLEKEQEFYKLAAAKGLPGLSPEEVRTMLQDGVTQQHLLEGLDGILTESELRDFKGLITGAIDPQSIHIDWQRVEERSFENIRKQVMDHSTRRARELSSQGGAGAVVNAMTNYDIQTHEERKSFIRALENARRQQSMKMQQHINALRSNLHELLSAVTKLNAQWLEEKGLSIPVPDRTQQKILDQLNDLNRQIKQKRAEIASARKELAESAKDEIAARRRWLSTAKSVLDGWITQSMREQASDEDFAKARQAAYDNDHVTSIIADTLAKIVHSSFSEDDAHYVMNAVLARAGILKYVHENEDYGFRSWLLSRKKPLPDQMVGMRSAEGTERMFDWIFAQAAAALPSTVGLSNRALVPGNLKVTAPNSAIVTDGDLIVAADGSPQLKVRELKPGQNYTFTYPTAEEKEMDPHARGGDPSVIVGEFDENAEYSAVDEDSGSVYNAPFNELTGPEQTKIMTEFLAARAAKIKESIERSDVKLDASIYVDPETRSIMVGISPVSSDYADLYKSYQKWRGDVASGKEEIKDLGSLSVLFNPITKEEMRDLFEFYAHYLQDDTRDKAASLGLIKGKELSEGEYFDLLNRSAFMVNRIKTNAQYKLPSGIQIAAYPTGSFMSDNAEATLAYIASGIDSMQTSKFLRRLFTLDESKYKKKVAAMLRRMADPSLSRRWSTQSYYASLGAIRKLISEHFKENAPGLTARGRGEETVLTPEDYRKNPFLVLGDPSIPENIQNAVRNFQTKTFEMSADLAGFYTLMEAAGYNQRYLSERVRDKLSNIIGSDVDASSRIKNISDIMTKGEFDSELVDSILSLAKKYESAAASLSTQFNPLGLMSAMYRAGYSYDGMHAVMSMVDAMAKNWWRKRAKGDPHSSVNDFYERMISKVYTQNPILGREEQHGASFTTETGRNATLFLFADTPESIDEGGARLGSEDPFTLVHEITHPLEISGMFQELLSDRHKAAIRQWFGSNFLPQRKFLESKEIDKAVKRRSNLDIEQSQVTREKDTQLFAGWRQTGDGPEGLVTLYSVMSTSAMWNDPNALLWTSSERDANAILAAQAPGTAILNTIQIPVRWADQYTRTRMLDEGVYGPNATPLSDDEREIVKTSGEGMTHFFPTPMRQLVAKESQPVLNQQTETWETKDVWVPVGVSYINKKTKTFIKGQNVYIGEDGKVRSRKSRYPKAQLLVSNDRRRSLSEKEYMERTRLSEALTAALHMSVVQSEVKDKRLNEAFEIMRSAFFDYMGAMAGRGSHYTISGIDVLSEHYHPALVDAMLSIFGDDVQSTKKLFHVGDGLLQMVATMTFKNECEKRVGIDVTPLLKMSHQLRLENKDATMRSLRDLLEKKSVWRDAKGMFHISQDVTNPRTLQMTLGFNPDAFRRDPNLNAEFGQWQSSLVSMMTDYVRQVNLNQKGDVNFKEDINATLSKAPEKMSPEDAVEKRVEEREFRRKMGILEKELTPAERHQQIVGDQAKIDAAKALLSMTTPLATDPTVYDFVMKQTDRILNTIKPLAFSKNKEVTPTNITAHVGNKLKAMMKSWNRMFTTGTYDLEQLAEKLGLSETWWELQTMGGVFQEAHSVLSEGVFLKDNNGNRKWIGESLFSIIAEIPEEMRHDVWRYLASRREVELHDSHMKALADFNERMRTWSESGGVGPKPTRPKPITFSMNNLQTAHIVKLFIDGKYGTDGGAVGEFAKRIVQFSNNAVVEKLHNAGLLSDLDRHSLLSSGEWWTPFVKISEVLESSGASPLYNDGTKEALRSIKTDWGHGIEHPLDNIAFRAVATHLYVERQRVRNQVLGALVNGLEGEYSPDELARMGIFKPMDFEETEVSEEDYWKADPSRRRKQGVPRQVPMSVAERAKQITERGMESDRDRRLTSATDRLWTVDELKPLDRESFIRWAAHPANAAIADRTFAIWQGGKASYYTIEDPDLFEAIESIHPSELKLTNKLVRGALAMLNGVSVLTKLMGSAITHTPQFVSQMLLKDIPNAITRSQSGFRIQDFGNAFVDSLPYLIPELAVEFPETFKAWKDRQSSRAGQTSLLTLFQDPEVALSGTPGLYHKPIAGTAVEKAVNAIKSHFKSVEAARQIRQKGKSSISMWEGTKAVANATWELFGNSTAMMDAFLRMSERNAMNRGKGSKLITGSDKLLRYHPSFIDMSDRRITLDFSRRGPVLSTMAKLKMFVGPLFQDPIQIAEQMKSPGRLKSMVLKGVVSYTLPALMNFIRWKDDDEYKRLNWWDKFNYMLINKRKDGRFNRLPWGIGTLASVFRDFPLAAFHYISKNDPLAFHEWANNTVQQSPLNVLPFVQDTRDWLSNVVPSFAEPITNIATNRDPFSKAPIDYDQDKINKQLASERGKEKAGIIEYALANAPLPTNLSVRQWQYYMRKQFPGLANVVYSTANELATNMYHLAGGDPEIGALYHPTETSMLNWKTGTPYGPSSLPVNRLLQLYQDAEAANRSINALEKGSAKRNSLEARFPIYKFYNEFKTASNVIRQLKIDRGVYIKRYANSMSKEELDAQVRERFDRRMTRTALEKMEHYENFLYGEGYVKREEEVQ